VANISGSATNDGQLNYGKYVHWYLKKVENMLVRFRFAKVLCPKLLRVKTYISGHYLLGQLSCCKAAPLLPIMQCWKKEALFAWESKIPSFSRATGETHSFRTHGSFF